MERKQRFSSQSQSAKRDAPGAVARAFKRIAAIGSYDFCPWANRYVYWLRQPVGWFVVGAGAAGLTAAFLEPQMWIVFGALVTVMVTGMAWPWIAMRGTGAEVSFARSRSREGETVEVRLTITNRWPWPLWGLAIEKGFFVRRDDEEKSSIAALQRVPGWSRSEFTFEFQPESRGVYPHAPPEIATEFPFGIWRSSQPVEVQNELLVWPRTTSLAAIPSLGGEIAGVIGMLFDRPGNEGDVIGVRPYRDGDRLRSIHWAQTARRQSLVVSERQGCARRLVVVGIDLRAFSDEQVSPVDSSHQLEDAIRVAASIAQEFHAHHTDVRFMLGDLDYFLTPGAESLKRLFDALARFEDDGRDRTEWTFAREAMTVLVTSGQREIELPITSGGSVRLVRINRPSDAKDSNGSTQQSAWLQLETDNDPLLQLRHRWERACHDGLAK